MNTFNPGLRRPKADPPPPKESWWIRPEMRDREAFARAWREREALMQPVYLPKDGER